MRLPISPNASLMLIAPLALIGSVASNQVAIAQSEPAHTHDHDYEHFYIEVDSFDIHKYVKLQQTLVLVGSHQR